MELTLTVDLVHTSATLVEKHSLVAGDVYNPLYVDFAALTDAQVAAVSTGTLVLTLRKNNSAGAVLASASVFSSASRTATNGTVTPCPKMRQTTLLLNNQSVRNWFDEAAAETNPDMAKTVYVELSDSSTTYVSCALPLVLRSFAVGGTNPGYYTKDETDALLGAKQDTLSFAGPLSESSGSVSVADATTSSKGVVKVGLRLSVSDGVLSADDQTPTVDDEFDGESANAIQNRTVAAAVAGIGARLDAILKTDSGVESGRLKTVETALAEKADADGLAAVATSGSYNDLADKPAIPPAGSIGNKWHSGNTITGTSANPTQFPSSGIAEANAGDMYLNTTTSNVYRCQTGGNAAMATWTYELCLKGQTGGAGTSGQIKIAYSSVAAMTAGWATDGLLTGELAIVSSGSVLDADNGRLYRKGLANYEFLCDLSGNPGARWYVGTSVTGTAVSPAVFSGSGITAANVGDLYLNTSASGFYTCTTGGAADTAMWSYAGSLKGATGDGGDDGADGSVWYYGTAVTGTSANATVFAGSGIASAKVNDKYLNTSAGAVYNCSLGGSAAVATWVFLVSLKGSQGDTGAAGAKWFFGTELTGDSPVSGIAAGTPEVGDCFLNTSSGDVYECTSFGATVPAWAKRGSVKGSAGTDGTDGLVWHCGTSVMGTAGGEASVTDGLALHVGDLHFNTSTYEVHRCTAKSTDTTGSWSYLCSITSDGVTAPASHTGGYVPAWDVSDSLTAGYRFIATDRTRASGSASSTAVPSEYSVALALADKVDAPASHSAGSIPAWGDASSETLSNEYSVRDTAAGGIRVAAYAADSAVPTEKAVRAALDAVASSVSNLKIDNLAAGTAGSVRLDATQAVHGLLSAADKLKLDGLVSYSTATDLGEALADGDTMPVYDASSANAARIMAASRVWTYVASKLPSYRLDDLAVPEDNTDLNVSSGHHGLCPKLPAAAGNTKVLDGTGSWVNNDAANTFTGDAGTGGTRGQVPAPAAGDGAAAKFLCADGSWAVVPGGQQYTAWTFSDSGSWVLAWDEEAGEWTATDGTHAGTMSGTYARHATAVVFTYDDGTTHTVTAARTATSGVSVHSLSELTSFDGADELLLHDASAGAQLKATLANLAAFVQSFNRYDTLFVPAGAMTPGDTNGASPVEVYVAGNSTTHDAMRFPSSGAVATCVDFNVMLPDDWDLGTLKAKLVWRIPAVNSAVPDTNVKFTIAARAFGDTEDYSSAMGTAVEVVDTLHGTAEIHVTPASPNLAVGGTPAAGKMIHFLVTRSFSSVTDSLASDVYLLGIEFQFRRSGANASW